MNTVGHYGKIGRSLPTRPFVAAESRVISPVVRPSWKLSKLTAIRQATRSDKRRVDDYLVSDALIRFLVRVFFAFDGVV